MGSNLPEIDPQTLSSVINTIIIALAAVAAVWQLRKFTEQARLTVFMTYTERHSKIMAAIPESAFDPQESIFSIQNLSKEKKGEYLTAMRQYFNMCSEEFYLHQNKLLDKKVWGLWEKGMKFAMKTPSYQEAWASIREHEGYDDDFKKFIDWFAPSDIMSK